MKRGMELEVQRATEGAAFRPLDFGSERPKVMTYHSAKGLTVDSAFLPNLGKDCFPRASWADIERLLFVGITRATKWVFLGSREDGGFQPLEKIILLAEAGVLTIERAGDKSQDQRGRAAKDQEPPPRPDDFTDIL